MIQQVTCPNNFQKGVQPYASNYFDIDPATLLQIAVLRFAVTFFTMLLLKMAAKVGNHTVVVDLTHLSMTLWPTAVQAAS